jgi:glycosyltransferase involved in cell wall biosynthesis
MEVHASMVGDGESEFSVITNGFDPGDFEYRDSEMEQFYRDHERIFAHFGTVTKGSADVLMEAIEQLDSNEEQSVEGFRIYLISRWMDPSDRQRILKSEVERFFCIQDPVPHRQAVKLMKQADVLLLFVEDSPYWKTIHRGKLFEYMASGVPILAIAPDGVATQLIRESGTGRAVHPKDVDSLARVLRRIVEDYEGFRAEYYHPRWDVIQQYDRRRLTKRLVGIFDSLVNES